MTLMRLNGKIKQALFGVLFLIPIAAFSQSVEYFNCIHNADSLIKHKNYSMAAATYTDAFGKTSKVIVNDYYNAACAYALTNNSPMAFRYLNAMAGKKDFADFSALENDQDLNSLKKTAEWATLINHVKRNAEAVERNYNKPLKHELEEIFIADQKYRLMLDSAAGKFGDNSIQVKTLEDKIARNDADNLKKVTDILDHYGWLGTKTVGRHGAAALFIVIQHADSKPEIQEKYLKTLKLAITKGVYDEPSDYALLTDRLATNRHQMQVYGTQVKRLSSGKWVPLPIKDSVNIDVRRAEIGLPPLKYYLQHFNR